MPKWWWMLLLCGLCQPVSADINVAVASNFAEPMKDLADAFEQSGGGSLKLSFASSGKLFAQIRHGAPFALFLSADQAIPEALEANGKVAKNYRTTYAIGRLVLMAKSLPPGLKPLDMLKNGQYEKLAMANPVHAPYGQAAVVVLDDLKLIRKSRAKWVLGENVAQAYQFVHSGSAQLGFVALSQVIHLHDNPADHLWQVPAEYHPPILQDMVLLKDYASDPQALALWQFLLSDEAHKIIQQHGYQQPGK